MTTSSGDPATTEPGRKPSTTGHVEGQLAGVHDVSLYWQGWISENATAVVVLAHGGLEHGGRYSYVGSALSDAGMATYVVDFRGHGRSGKRPGQVESMSRLVLDLEVMVEEARRRHHGLPVFLLGHSLGAMVALEYVISGSRQLQGLVLSGTGIDVSAIPLAQARLATVLSRIAPNLGLVVFSGDDVSRDPDVVQAYKTDPLNFRGKVPVRTPAELLASARRVTPRLGEVTVPVLVIHGGADKVAAPAGAQTVFDRVASSDKSIQIYDGLFHEILNEPERDAVINDVVTWIHERQ